MSHVITYGKPGFRFQNNAANYLALTGTMGGATWTECTIEAYFYFISNGAFSAVISSTAGGQFIHFQSSGTGTDMAIYANTGAVLPTNGSLRTGWNHVALATKSGDTKLIINHKLTGTVTTAYTSIAAASNMKVGIGHNSIRPFNGWINYVRVWDVCRTQGEIIRDSMSAITSAPRLKFALYPEFGPTDTTGNYPLATVGSVPVSTQESNIVLSQTKSGSTVTNKSLIVYP